MNIKDANLETTNSIGCFEYFTCYFNCLAVIIITGQYIKAPEIYLHYTTRESKFLKSGEAIGNAYIICKDSKKKKKIILPV